MEWKIALPAHPSAGTDVQAPSPQSPDAFIPPSDRELLAARMSPWLDRDYVETLTDADVVVLATALSRLSKTRSDDDELWRAVASTEAIPIAENAISAYETILSDFQALRATDRALMEDFGFDPTVPPGRNARTAADMAERYGTIAAQIGNAGRVLQECGVVAAPTLADILFLSDVLPSLLAADVDLIGAHPATPSELSVAKEALALMDEAAAAMKAETHFDPSAHAVETLSGIRRATLTRKAADFVTAFSMFGVSFSGAEKAQKASGLMKKYLTACDAFGVASGEAPKQRLAMKARLDLDASIARRAAILADDRISPKLKDIAKGEHVARLTRLATGLGPDARRIVEDNLPTAMAMPAVGLVEHLGTIASNLRDWSDRTSKDVETVGGSADSHQALEEAIDDIRREMTTLGGFSISSASDVDQVQRHVLWLREATLLPVSDVALQALFSRHGKVPLPTDL
jgi:hypothetical protein